MNTSSVGLSPRDIASIFYLALAALLIWWAARGIKNIGNRGRVIDPGERTGIGGWLLLLIVSLMILSPLMSLGQQASGFFLLELKNPSLVGISKWEAYKTMTWWVLWVSIVISMYAGYLLIRGRTMVAVTRVKVLLWVIGPLGVVLSLIIAMLAFGAAIAINKQLLSPLLVTTISAGIWTAYLTKSRRVQSTYGGGSRVGNTALMTAAELGDIEAAKQLLARDRALIDAQDAAGGTALHYAVLNKQLEMTEYLLDAGANPFLTTKKGRTAMFLAGKINWSDGYSLLETRIAASPPD